jgi:hypothetical protein
MKYKTPKISNEDIYRIIERDFTKNNDVLNILNKFTQDIENDSNRVYAAILKISDCSVEKVEKYVEVANVDYRDVLTLAEYPNYNKFYHDRVSDEKKSQLLDSDEKKSQLLDEDWKQYHEWLNKLSPLSVLFSAAVGLIF